MSEASVKHVALVTGATGLVGRYVVMHLLELGTWKVYAVSRSPKLNIHPKEMPEGFDSSKLVHVQAESGLSEKGDVLSAFKDMGDVTHIFQCAFHTTKSDPWQDVGNNLSLLVNVVESIEEIQAGGDNNSQASGTPGKLQHVYVQTGAKWYGQELGKYKTPAKETDSRYLTPNFYYNMVDYCAGRASAGAPWTWSSLLPNPVIGYSPSSFMNLLNAVAGYAIICRQMGLPFRFPGSDEAYNAVTECCDVRLLAQAAVFTSTTPAAANQIFNVSNGDVYRWSEVWPAIAKAAGLDVAPPQAVSMAQLMAMPDKQQAWQAALQGCGLSDKPDAAANNYERLIEWSFADFCFSKDYDFFQSVTKLRQAGFTAMKIDTTNNWLGWMRHLTDLALFPPIVQQTVSTGVGQGTAAGQKVPQAAEAPAGAQQVAQHV